MNRFPVNFENVLSFFKLNSIIKTETAPMELNVGDDTFSTNISLLTELNKDNFAQKEPQRGEMFVEINNPFEIRSSLGAKL